MASKRNLPNEEFDSYNPDDAQPSSLSDDTNQSFIEDFRHDLTAAFAEINPPDGDSYESGQRAENERLRLEISKLNQIIDDLKGDSKPSTTIDFGQQIVNQLKELAKVERQSVNQINPDQQLIARLKVLLKSYPNTWQ